MRFLYALRLVETTWAFTATLKYTITLQSKQSGSAPTDQTKMHACATFCRYLLFNSLRPLRCGRGDQISLVTNQALSHFDRNDITFKVAVTAQVTSAKLKGISILLNYLSNYSIVSSQKTGLPPSGETAVSVLSQYHAVWLNLFAGFYDLVHYLFKSIVVCFYRHSLRQEVDVDLLHAVDFGDSAFHFCRAVGAVQILKFKSLFHIYSLCDDMSR